MKFYDHIDLEFLTNQTVGPTLVVIEDMLDNAKNVCTCRTCLRDIAAFALSNLPAVYRGSIWDEAEQAFVAENKIHEVVQLGIHKICKNPHHGN